MWFDFGGTLSRQFLFEREGGGDGGGDGFVGGGGVVHAVPAGFGRVARGDLDDAGTGGAEFLYFASAEGGDLFGADAGVFGGFAHHFDFCLTGFGVDEFHFDGLE